MKMHSEDFSISKSNRSRGISNATNAFSSKTVNFNKK